MTTIRAVVTGGRLEVDVPPDWPDGIEVEIQPLGAGASGATDPMPPEEIAALLTAMDRLEPLSLTEAERAAWDEERRARKDWERSRFPDPAAKLRGTWE